MTLTILVTGSRDWTDRDRLNQAFLDQWLNHDRPNLHLLSGACPTGADRMAEEIIAKQGNGHVISTFEADWDKHGKRAGYVRNAEMVALKPDLCLAFIKSNSKGASMTAQLAESAGIPTIIYREN